MRRFFGGGQSVTKSQQTHWNRGVVLLVSENLNVFRLDFFADRIGYLWITSFLALWVLSGYFKGSILLSS